MTRLRNWAGDVRWRPVRFDRPRTDEALVAAVRSSDAPLRVLGAGHSFTPLAASEHHSLQLDRLAGLVAIDRERQQATIRAGTRLRDLGPLLAAEGLALENQGDIDVQSLGGVLATATHGTGVGLGCIASRALAIQLITASGDTTTLDRQRDGDRFRGAVVAMGTLGVVSQVTMQLRPLYRLRDTRRTVPLDECLAGIEATAGRHRHFEFLWFPHTDLALTKTLDVIPASGGDPADHRDRARSWLGQVALDNAGYWLVCQVGRLLPGRAPALNRFCARTSTEGSWRGPAHRIFPSPRLVRFKEMEYAVAAARGPDCLRELRAFIHQRRLPVLFPFEYRYVAADDLWMSPFFERPSATISVHMYRRQDHRPLFEGAEAIFRNHGGRPHWGKKHSAGPDYLRRVYPRFDEFLALRQQMDPGGRFLNSHLGQVLLGESPS
jgi:FAD-linked oxidoreductase